VIFSNAISESRGHEVQTAMSRPQESEACRAVAGASTGESHKGGPSIKPRGTAWLSLQCGHSTSRGAMMKKRHGRQLQHMLWSPCARNRTHIGRRRSMLSHSSGNRRSRKLFSDKLLGKPAVFFDPLIADRLDITRTAMCSNCQAVIYA